MIKTIMTFIDKELNAAEEYVEFAYAKKRICPETAGLFITLAGEEIAHAEKLLKRGYHLSEKIDLSKEGNNYEHNLKEMAIWEWEQEQAGRRIMELHSNISSYKSNY